MLEAWPSRVCRVYSGEQSRVEQKRRCVQKKQARSTFFIAEMDFPEANTLTVGLIYVSAEPTPPIEHPCHEQEAEYPPDLT
jgi:hypothetical protein